jgi:parallel beta-helix repeat protein
LLFILISASVFAFNIQSAKAAFGTITINPDGSISSPVPANITSHDNVTYTFTGNNYLPIVVNRHNIIVNGERHTLQASGGDGFSLTGMSNVTIKNTTITNSYCGIYLSSSSGNVLSGNDATANSYCGIYLSSSSWNVLLGNYAAANSIGIYLRDDSNNTLQGNDVTANNNSGVWLDYSSHDGLSDNYVAANRGDGIVLSFSLGNVLSGNDVRGNSGDGISLHSSSGNVLSSNVMASNDYNFGVVGGDLRDSVNYVDTSNLADGRPIYYLIDQSNIVINPQTYPEGAGYLGLVNCKNVTVQGLTLTKNVQGLLLANTTDSKINDNNVTANEVDGIDLSNYCDNNTLYGNNVTANGNEGIFLWYSSGNAIFGNNVSANEYFGIDLWGYCYNNTLSKNNIKANQYGIYLQFSGNNTLDGNNVTANSHGISLWDYSSANILSGNDFTRNNYTGIYLYFSSNNRIFHNDFFDNTQQAYESNSTNAWDNGYPSGGNYWSDYRATYPGAVENDSSAIWDTPYFIDANNTDRYPLMDPFHTFSVGTWNGVAYSVDTVSNSTLSNFTFNPTRKTLSFNVTGTTDTLGFCRVDIPTGLMSGQWTVIVGSVLYSNQTIKTLGNYTYIYFNYTQGNKTVQIKSTNAVPEFQPFMLLPLFMIITLLGIMILNRKRNERKWPQASSFLCARQKEETVYSLSVSSVSGSQPIQESVPSELVTSFRLSFMPHRLHCFPSYTSLLRASILPRDGPTLVPKPSFTPALIW